MSRFIIIFAIVGFCGSVSSTKSESSSACPTWCQPAEERDDYTYTEGIGAHKVHTVRAKGWNAARRTCNAEGGYLAIVNSVAEAKLIAGMLRKAKLNYAHIGHHDLFERNDWVTLHSETLAKAGYSEWGPGQPGGAHGEDCGGLDENGKLHDVYCDEHWFFVCELTV